MSRPVDTVWAVLAGIDHLSIACADPDAAAAEIEQRLGLRATGGGRHDAHGTFNRLIWLGDSYLELMGIFDQSIARESWWGAHLDRLLGEAPAAYAGLALASDDLGADVARLRRQGSSISDPTDGQRLRPDGDVVRWRIGRLPAPDPDLGLIFLIEHDTDSAEWRPADRQSRAGQVHPIGTSGRLARIDMPVADVRSATMRLLRGLGLQFRPSLSGQGARDTSVGRQTLSLALARPGVMPRIVLSAGNEPVEAELLGCRWSVTPSS